MSKNNNMKGHFGEFILMDQIELHNATLDEAVEVLKEMYPNMTDEEVSILVNRYKRKKS